MNIYKNVFVLVLIAISFPAQAQNPVNKAAVLQTVTMSGSLIACGYNKEGGNLGLSVARLFPKVGLTDRSPEVIEATLKGQRLIRNGSITCANVVRYAKKIGAVP